MAALNHDPDFCDAVLIKGRSCVTYEYCGYMDHCPAACGIDSSKLSTPPCWEYIVKGAGVTLAPDPDPADPTSNSTSPSSPSSDHMELGNQEALWITVSVALILSIVIFCLCCCLYRRRGGQNGGGGPGGGGGDGGQRLLRELQRVCRRALRGMRDHIRGCDACQTRFNDALHEVVTFLSQQLRRFLRMG
jgi:hypothetical protein